MNWESEQALEYHEQTKHSPASIRRNQHRMEWNNKPAPFKEYVGRDEIQLPDPAKTEKPIFSHLGGRNSTETDAELTPEVLSRICHDACGVVSSKQIGPDRTHYFRTAACAGALYPTECYVVTPELNSGEVPAGVYHFHPRDRVLTVLREGDYRSKCAEFLPETPDTDGLYVILSSIPWRSSWKYQARAYRHLFWDSGTIMANLFTVASASGMEPTLFNAFYDEGINRLLGIGAPEEFTVGVVHCSLSSKGSDNQNTELNSMQPSTEPLSDSPREYELIKEAYRHSQLQSDDLNEWTDRLDRFNENKYSWDTLEVLDINESTSDGLETVIERRGSSREFRDEAIDADEYLALLDFATKNLPAYFARDDAFSHIRVFFLCRNLDGLDPGSYEFKPGRGIRELDTLPSDEAQKTMTHLCLDQPLGGQAASVAFTIADLRTIVDNLGNRGYRVAQHEGGIFLGNLNLATYARKLASTGLTFYDDRVCETFDVEPEKHGVMTATAVGMEGQRDDLR